MFSPLSKRRMEMLEANSTLFERLTRTQGYELGSVALIVLNAMVILWETQRRAELAIQGAAPDEWERVERNFGVAAVFFCIAFSADLAIRLLADRWSFFRARELGWNLFDCFVVLTAAAEVLVLWSSSSVALRMFLRKFSMLRIVRILRVVRVTRNIRFIRFIRELRLMVYSLTGALKSLAWSIVLMLNFLMVFGVFFTDGVVEYFRVNGGPDAAESTDLKKYFGTLSSSIISLYMAMSGGEDWANVMRILDPLSYEYRLLFLTFVTFAIFALLNVVTAVFVGTAMERWQHDRELVVQMELQHKGEFVSILRQVFEELDANGSGSLSMDEFERHIGDEKIMAYLRTLEIDISQVRTLFTLLDVDRTGEVDLDEFVSGCLRLRGGATSMDLAILKYQVEWILRNVTSVASMLEADRGPPSPVMR